MDRRPALVALALVSAAVAAACGDDTGSPTARVEGRSFVLGHGHGSVDGFDLPDDVEVRIGFQEGRVAAHAGCNSLSGDYSLDGDVLVVEALASTMMACADELMALDAWLTELLTSSPTVRTDGDALVVVDGAAQLTLIDRATVDPDRSLEGTTWQVDGVVRGDSMSSVPVGVTASVRIEGDDVLVETGCNSGRGAVQVDGDGTSGLLTFGPIAVTERACDPDRMALEQAVLATLTGAVEYRIEADRLMLQASGIGLQLHAEP